jgi:hypothetical protein
MADIPVPVDPLILARQKLAAAQNEYQGANRAFLSATANLLGAHGKQALAQAEYERELAKVRI